MEKLFTEATKRHFLRHAWHPERVFSMALGVTEAPGVFTTAGLSDDI